eukprot:3274420-Amphidinium_carterae.2
MVTRAWIEFYRSELTAYHWVCQTHPRASEAWRWQVQFMGHIHAHTIFPGFCSIQSSKDMEGVDSTSATRSIRVEMSCRTSQRNR